MSRSRARPAANRAMLGGFAIPDIKRLGSSLAASLGRQLEMQHLRAHDFHTSRGQSIRIASPVPMYRDDGQQCPVLLLKPAVDSVGVYLEVALDYEFVSGGCGLTHVSLKVHTGPSPRASALRFRAEWDPRFEARMHAQPHWNIDQIGGGEGYASSPVASAATSAPWIPETKMAPWVTATEPTPTPRVLDMRKIHFAMGSTWHLPLAGEDHRHSAPFQDEASLVRWVSGCAGYIRAQLAHA